MPVIEVLDQIIKPKEYNQDVLSIDLGYLHKRGIKLLLIDIDNTLVTANEDYPSVRIVHWFQELHNYNFKTVLLSNSWDAGRIRKIARTLDADAFYFVCKPFTFIIRQIIERFRIDASETALIGDQIMADIICGNLLKLHTILINRCDSQYSDKDRIGILQQTKTALLDKVIHRNL